MNKVKGFNYQITVKVLLKKYKCNKEIEFAPVYFNSFTKTIINQRFKLENYFQEILCMINIWIIKRSDWNLNQSSLNTVTFQLIDLYQEVFIWTYLLN